MAQNIDHHNMVKKKMPVHVVHQISKGATLEFGVASIGEYSLELSRQSE